MESVSFSEEKPIQNLSELEFSHKVLGEGAYGMVMEAVHKETKRKVAVKINVTERTIVGIGSLKEADLISRINGHPFTVRVEGMVFGEPELKEVEKYNRANNKHNRCKTRIDSLHFVLAKEPSSLDFVIKRRSQMSFRCMKIIFAQILLSLEWIHGHGIIHRDIKPANILMSGSLHDPHIRICDFGLGGSLGGPKATTPGAVTSWYRPPEICLNRSYGVNVDVWSAAAVAFEMVSKRALLYGTADENDEIIQAIFRRFPNIASADVLRRMSRAAHSKKRQFSLLTDEAQKGVLLNGSLSEDFRHADSAKRIRKALRLSATDVQKFCNEETLDEFCNEESSGGGTLDEFCDLLASMLSFDPSKRPSATEALEHSFFNWLRKDLIDPVREKHPPTLEALPLVQIIPCRERAFVVHLIHNLYNHRSEIEWYSHRILFHALDLYDRYLAYIFSEKNSSSNTSSTSYPNSSSNTSSNISSNISSTSSSNTSSNISSKSFSTSSSNYSFSSSPEEVYLRVYTCCYMFRKYFLTLDLTERWEDFFPSQYWDEESKVRAAAFERFVYRDVCNKKLYRDTLYEYVKFKEGKLRESRVRECLMKLGSLNFSAAEKKVSSPKDESIFPLQEGGKKLSSREDEKKVSLQEEKKFPLREEEKKFPLQEEKKFPLQEEKKFSSREGTQVHSWSEGSVRTLARHLNIEFEEDVQE